MVCRTAIALAALVMSVFPAKAAEDPSHSIRLNTLSAGQRLMIRTAEREYRLQLVDPKTGESLVAGSLDGKEFSTPEKMFVVGATRGADANTGGYSLVLMGEIRQGMSIEWGRGSLDAETRGTTSPVRSISVLPN
jgi:hypothetical protein